MKPIHILLVEDNEGDVLLTTEAFAEGKNAYKISVTRDGVEAIEFLNRTGAYINAALPDIILLDINLPRKNGHEVLQYIKSSECFKQIPVIMLTTSSAETDINLAYKNHANCYITKPHEMETFQDVVAKIESFWFLIVKLPVNHNSR